MRTSRFNQLVFILICFFLIISIPESEVFAQRKDTSDYFAIGVFSGSYIGQYPLYGKNTFINSIVIELEYYKYSDLSFYTQGFYQFMGNDIRKMFQIPSYNSINVVQKPETDRVNISFGGKYFLRNKNVNPFFNLGVNQEANFIGAYHYDIIYSSGEISHQSADNKWTYKLSINIGVGLSIKLNDKFKIELKYDMYKSILNQPNGFTGFSAFGGVKYNL